MDDGRIGSRVMVPAAIVMIGFIGSCWNRPVPPPQRQASSTSRPAVTVPVVGTLVGAGSCTSSGCHAAGVDGHAPWQSAYTVWAESDPHARASAVLREPLAAQMVSSLAAAEGEAIRPAHEHTSCIGCHATARGTAAVEGVSCESCHGAAGGWLVAHTLPDWKAEGNRLGMIETRDAFACASTCAGCHVGGSPSPDGLPREVTHELIAAGHPRLAFELTGHKRAEPPHWKARGDQSVDWAKGRLATLEAVVGRLAVRSAAARAAESTGDVEEATRKVGWPELSEFDCYGCHRPAALVGSNSRRMRGKPVGVASLEPFAWAQLACLVSEEDANRLAALRRKLEVEWFRTPDAESLEQALAVLVESRHSLNGWDSRTPADRASLIVRHTEPSDWNQAAAASIALEAIADDLPDPDQSRSILAELRRLLEFQTESINGRSIRFDSPREYDASAIARLLAACRESIASGE